MMMQHSSRAVGTNRDVEGLVPPPFVGTLDKAVIVVKRNGKKINMKDESFLHFNFVNFLLHLRNLVKE